LECSGLGSGAVVVVTQPRAIRASTIAFHRVNIERAIHLMRIDLAAPLCLADLAHAARMSEFHFVRVFRELTGLPPLRFLSMLRLAEARDLLIDTDESVTEICFRVGYNSVGTFTRRFTHLVGISPLRLRHCAQRRDAPVLGWRTRLLEGAEVRVFIKSGDVGPEPASQALIAVFRTPLPFGRPTACEMTKESGALFPSRLGIGCHYFLAFGLVGRMRVCGSPVLVAINDAAMTHEVHITLRMIAPTDPPLLSFVPYILCRRYIEE
jgi:AraC family transcriptional regulator